MSYGVSCFHAFDRFIGRLKITIILYGDIMNILGRESGYDEFDGDVDWDDK